MSEYRALRPDRALPPDPRTNADYRFTRGPYHKFAYPYQVYYPAYTYPKIDRRYAIIPPKPNRKKVNTSSLKDVVQDIMQEQKIDNRMQPYIFRHYILPTYYELWDYNKDDAREAAYNEMLRLEIAREVYDAPGSSTSAIIQRRRPSAK
jgi:hypothetical protein